MKALFGLISWMVLFFIAAGLSAMLIGVDDRGFTFGRIVIILLMISALCGNLIILIDWIRLYELDKKLKKPRPLTKIGDKYFIYDTELNEKFGDIGDNSFYWRECTIIKISTVNNREIVDVKTCDGDIKIDVRLKDLRTQKII